MVTCACDLLHRVRKRLGLNSARMVNIETIIIRNYRRGVTLCYVLLDIARHYYEAQSMQLNKFSVFVPSSYTFFQLSVCGCLWQSGVEFTVFYAYSWSSLLAVADSYTYFSDGVWHDGKISEFSNSARSKVLPNSLSLTFFLLKLPPHLIEKMSGRRLVHVTTCGIQSLCTVRVKHVAVWLLLTMKKKSKKIAPKLDSNSVPLLVTACEPSALPNEL